MYSVVLMMAMTSGAEMPALGHRGGGCHGRRGGGGCCGSSGGGYGGGCYGSTGYGGGCTGGGYGGGCYGSTGYGGGMGYGGCTGSGMGYGGGCTGGGMGYGATSGGVGCYGGGMGYPGGMMPGGVMPGGVAPEPVKKMPKPAKSSQAAPPTATIVVALPADAKLSIDDSPTTSTGPSRVFVSPALPADRDCHYTLKAEVVRNGKPITMEQRVKVRAGQETPVTFTLPATGVAAR